MIGFQIWLIKREVSERNLWGLSADEVVEYFSAENKRLITFLCGIVITFFKGLLLLLRFADILYIDLLMPLFKSIKVYILRSKHTYLCLDRIYEHLSCSPNQTLGKDNDELIFFYDLCIDLKAVWGCVEKTATTNQHQKMAVFFLY